MRQAGRPQGPEMTIRLLGAPRVDRGGETVDIARYHKLSGLLAWLALEAGNAVARERIAELLWPERADGARVNLRKALSQMRQWVFAGDADAWLQTSRDTVMLLPAAAEHVDILAFDRLARGDGGPSSDRRLAQLEAALALYRGDLLEGIQTAHADEFEGWLEAQRLDYRKRAVAICRELVDARSERGENEAALAAARRWTRLGPLDETGHRRLMTLLAEGGDRSGALEVFDALRDRLANELEVLPEPRTRRLADRLRRGPAGDEPPACKPVESETRHLTVLNVALENTFAESPEDLAEDLEIFETICREAIGERGGHPHLRGGRVMGWFGYPASWEHASIDAIRAGFEIRDQLDALTDEDETFRIRIGIHAGPVMVQPGGGDQLRIIGSVETVSARIRDMAPADDILVSERVRAASQGFFATEPWVDCTLPGDNQPVATHRVLRDLGHATRIEAQGPGLAPLVGRDRELVEIRRRVVRRVDDPATLIHVQAPPGMGKSRLMHELRRRIESPPLRWRQARCAAGTSQTPFDVSIQILEQGLAADSPGTSRLSALESLLAGLPELPGDSLALIAGLLGIEGAPGASALPETPAERRAQLIDRLLRLTREIARHEPVVMVIEDAHWIDPSTAELLREYARRRGDWSGVTLIVTSRPEGFPGHERLAPDLHLELPALEPDQALDLARAHAADELDPAQARELARRSGGNPLFLEELLRNRESKPSETIPGSLYDLINARLDLLGEAKATLQTAAVIGEQFSAEDVAGLTGRPTARIAEELDRGVVLEWLLAGPAAGQYRFRHALLRDGAYQVLTARSRRALHWRWARRLETSRPELLERAPEQIARHYSLSRDTSTAVGLWYRAAQRALAHSALEESRFMVEQGLEDVARLEDPHARAEREYAFRILEGNHWLLAEGFGSEQTWTAFRRALAIAEGSAGRISPTEALIGLWQGSSSFAKFDESKRLARQVLDHSNRGGSDLERASALYTMGASHFWPGEFRQALPYFRQAIEIYPRADAAEASALLGASPSSLVRVFLALNHWFIDADSDWQDWAESALEESLRLPGTQDEAFIRILRARLHQVRRDFEAMRAEAEIVARLAAANGYQLWGLCSEALLGLHAAACGSDEAALATIRRCHETVPGAMRGIQVIIGSLLIEAQVRQGHFHDALRNIDKALEQSRMIGDHHYDAELLRLKAIALARTRDDLDGARQCLRRGHALAVQQGAGTLQRRLDATLADIAPADLPAG